MIRVENLAVTFAKGTPLEKTALAGVSLTMEAGEFVSVIGSNGAGKSTLLNALAGDFPPSGGRIAIDGADVSRRSTVGRSKLVARVFQDPLAGSCGDLTIEENLALATARGLRRGLRSALGADRRTLFRDRLAALGLGLENRLQDRMAMLSGGQRQALALIMATLAKSSVLLLDEHTAALDPGMAEFVLGLTERTVAEHRLTTLMVTHSMRQALDLGTRTVMLHEGRIILDVGGDERNGLGVEDLVEMFRRQRGEALDEDQLLL
ncbi:MAG: ABC transporter ATP-binding protein [Hyphomicrobiales bacterium]|nr:ABC transporter ATP-binding protein [Hyphomicrobiales bacterium]